MAVRRRETPVDFRRPELRQHPQERAPVLAHPPVAVHHLIEIVRTRLIARQDGLGVRDRPRGAVEMGHRTIKPEFGRRRSRVIGYSSDRSSGGMLKDPGVCP